jgi:hypothetical protein
MRHALFVAGRGFCQVLPVQVTGYLVALIASMGQAAPMRLYGFLFASSAFLSCVWWLNSSAAKSGHWRDSGAYGLGAGCGTLSGVLLTRWLVG